MQKKDPLRSELIQLLNGGNAHADFDTAIANIPKKLYGATVKNLSYNLWELLEHARLTQADILDYIQNPDYEEKPYLEGYWPKQAGPANATEWNKSVKAFHRDLKEIIKIVKNPKINLLETPPHLKNGPSYLHEIMLVVDHNAYHIGQIIMLRELLGNWKD